MDEHVPLQVPAQHLFTADVTAQHRLLTSSAVQTLLNRDALRGYQYGIKNYYQNFQGTETMLHKATGTVQVQSCKILINPIPFWYWYSLG
jgi:hypothetical protein